MPAHTGDKLLDSKSYFNSGLQHKSSTELSIIMLVGMHYNVQVKCSNHCQTGHVRTEHIKCAHHCHFCS